MSIEDDIAFLERVPLLRHLGTGALRILAIGSEIYSVEAGQTLFAAGETADCAFVVQDGSFTLQPDRAADAETVAEAGALLGEAALFAPTTRPDTAIAREDSTVLRISRKIFLKTLESFPDGAQFLRDMIASRADQWAREIENVRAKLTRDDGGK